MQWPFPAPSGYTHVETTYARIPHIFREVVAELMVIFSLITFLDTPWFSFFLPPMESSTTTTTEVQINPRIFSPHFRFGTCPATEAVDTYLHPTCCVSLFFHTKDTPIIITVVSFRTCVYYNKLCK